MTHLDKLSLEKQAIRKAFDENFWDAMQKPLPPEQEAAFQAWMECSDG